MGQRTEQRIAVSLPVLARGMDSHGNPFEAMGETHDISCSGACVEGITAELQPGNKIEIQYKNQTAWYRVQWIDKATDGKCCAGLRCLEPGTYIWGVPLKGWEPDTYDPSQAGPVSEPVLTTARPLQPSWSGADRRQFPRRSCRIEAQVTMDGGLVRLSGTVTDISLGGCYVEMLAPLPVDTAVELLLRIGEGPMQISGKVRSSQTGLGMGIAFTGMRPADFEKLQRLAPVPSKPVVVPHPPERQPSGVPLQAATQVGASPTPTTRSAVQKPGEAGAVPASPEAFQALLRVLFRKGLLTREELIEEMEKSKPTRVA